jgi:hypothetical protein
VSGGERHISQYNLPKHYEFELRRFDKWLTRRSYQWNPVRY